MSECSDVLLQGLDISTKELVVDLFNQEAKIGPHNIILSNDNHLTNYVLVVRDVCNMLKNVRFGYCRLVVDLYCDSVAFIDDWQLCEKSIVNFVQNSRIEKN